MDRQTIGLKLVIVGDGAVGKTSLLFSYAQNKFPRQYQPTVFDNKTTTLKIDNHIIHLGLWDTAGQEQYARLRPLAYNNADIFMITFSVVDRDSYNNVVRKWYKEIGAVAANSVVLIVGNKIDLRNQAFNSADFVTKAEAEKFAKSHKCQYSECSALTRQGLVQTFEKGVRLALEMRNKDEKNMKAAEDSCPCQLI